MTYKTSVNLNFLIWPRLDLYFEPKGHLFVVNAHVDNTFVTEFGHLRLQIALARTRTQSEQERGELETNVAARFARIARTMWKDEIAVAVEFAHVTQQLQVT
jgi:hypothetical protein